MHHLSNVADSRGDIWTVTRECAKIDEVEKELRSVKTDGCTMVHKYHSSDTTIKYATVCYCHTDFCNNSIRINSQKTWTWICVLILLSVISQHVL